VLEGGRNAGKVVQSKALAEIAMIKVGRPTCYAAWSKRHPRRMAAPA